MIYRAAILSSILLTGVGFTIPACAAKHEPLTYRGTCIQSNISESDGVRTGAAGGSLSTKDYFVLMKRAKAAHMTPGSDGFLWKAQPVTCDSLSIEYLDDYQGHRIVTFSVGDAKPPIFGFAGRLVQGEGPMLFAETLYGSDGRAMLFASGINAPRCQFYYTDDPNESAKLALDPGSNSSAQVAAKAEGYNGWETHIKSIECHARVKAADGHLLIADLRFNVAERSPQPRPSRDPATDVP